MPSFGVASTIGLQEVDNAVNQAKKEIATCYDSVFLLCVPSLCSKIALKQGGFSAIA